MLKTFVLVTILISGCFKKEVVEETKVYSCEEMDVEYNLCSEEQDIKYDLQLMLEDLQIENYGEEE